ncbi:hypothetical protein H0H93_000191 [Arthromyces matolae]|nr:hypothetical protein H0H93_000191 [Arthromyces matolae]
MSKRTISQQLNDERSDESALILDDLEASRPTRRPKLDAASHSDSPEKFIQYPDISRPTAKQTPFQQPTPVLSFSYNSSHQLEFNDSALRYYVDPPHGAKLSYGYDLWKRKPDGRGRIDGLLQAFSKARKTSTVPLHDVGVIAWRGVITRDEFEINIMVLNGTLYFEEHLSEERLKQKNNMEPRHRIQTYYGYAFESYCTSEIPNPKVSPNPGDPVGWGGDVDTNIQWCSVVRTKLGNTRLLIGGEVDCVRGQFFHYSDADRNELKSTQESIHNSFLLGVPEVVVGFRTPSGVLTTTQTFKTIQLPRLVRGKPGAWDPLICLAWGDQVISFLKDVVRSNGSEDASIWRAKFTPGKGITVTLLEAADVEDVRGGEDRVGFLPTWYWEESRTNEKRPETTSKGGWKIE